jgi:oxygen-independent coproporphyrinogen-3 oxidase
LAREHDMERYMTAVKKEVEMIAASPYARRTLIDSIYFGGGTPSALNADRMIEILSFIKTQYHILPRAQVTFEGTPNPLDRIKLERIWKAGTNRINIGVQTFNETLGRALGLPHTPRQAVETLKNAIKAGFINIGINFMYNLPGQTLANWLSDLKIAIDMNITHSSLSAFNVISAANFLEQIEKGLVPAPGCENYEIDLFIAARDLLLKSGYIHYSIGNFAKPHYIDKHTIWYYKKQKDLFSHGPGAYGYINRCMYINRSGLTEYFKCVGKGFLPVNAVEKADEIEAMHGMMVKSLQAISVDRTDFVNLFNHDPLEQFQEKIKNLVQSELLEITDKEIRLTEKGIPWGYNVCKEFYSEKNKQSFIARIRPGKGRKSRSLVVSGNQMPKGT